MIRVSILLLAALLLVPACQPRPTNMASSSSLHIPHTHEESPQIKNSRKQNSKRWGSEANNELAPRFVDPQFKNVFKKSHFSFLKLDCQVTNPESNLSVTWTKNNQPFSCQTTRCFQEQNKGQVLIIENTIPEDSGNYTCIVSNEHGAASKQFMVEIYYKGSSKPILRQDVPGNATVLIGSNVTLFCEIQNPDSQNPGEIIWVRHHRNAGHRLEDANSKPLYDKLQHCSIDGMCLNGTSYYNVEKTMEYTLINLQANDSGWYSCMVANFFGEAISSGYVTVVEEIPQDPAIVEAHQQKNTIILSTMIVVTIVVLVLASIAIFFRRRAEKELRKRRKTDMYAKEVIVWTKQVIVEMNADRCSFSGSSEGSCLLNPKVTIQKLKITRSKSDKSICGEYIYQLDPRWEFDRNKLILGDILGEGAFGRVVSATAEGIRSEAEVTRVAVKMLKEGHTDEDVKNLMYEVQIMKSIGEHENIINLLGECTQPSGKQLYVIVEFAKFGNLKNFLLVHRPSPYMIPVSGSEDHHLTCSLVAAEVDPITLELSDLLNIAYQVANGMQFLASRKCLHRDLAARNVLVCENQIYKIADFGMARDAQDTDYYRKATGGRVPLKWMAPEAIFERKCTTQSDVWSYGVLLWEIMSFGENPYHNINPDVFVELLKYGQRLSKPPGCPVSVYDLMLECWRFVPEDRPGWSSIVERTRRLHTSFQEGTYLQLTSDNVVDYLIPIQDFNCTMSYLSSVTFPSSPPPTPTDLIQPSGSDISYANVPT